MIGEKHNVSLFLCFKRQPAHSNHLIRMTGFADEKDYSRSKEDVAVNFSGLARA